MLSGKCLVPDVDTAGPTDEKCQTSSTPDLREIGWVLWGLNLSCVVCSFPGEV